MRLPTKTALRGAGYFTTKAPRAFYVSDVSLKVLHSKAAHNKPEFERTETSAERNLPVLENKKQENLLIIQQAITTVRKPFVFQV